VLQFAQDARWRFGGGVWFVDLTSASNETTMLRAVAQVLGIPLSPSGAAEQLGRVLGTMSEVLLVLDNLGQIAQEAAEVVSTWLTHAPQLRVIQTRRRRVPVQGEAVLSLGPLGTRSAQQALFVARAHSARPGRLISEGDARAVEQIVEALEGIPLAIELAAARTAVMSPPEIARHLRQARLSPEALSVSMDGLLASAGGARAERHLTMRACLSWSWSLLAEPERAALTQLAVFEGGFDSAAADAVLAVQTLPTFDLLQSLTQHSWIGLRSATGPESSPRFVLLELVRAFALEQLEDAQAVRTRHAAYFASFGTLDFHSKVCSQGGVEAYNELLLEIDNLAAATRSAAQTGADEVAVALLSAGDLLVDRGFRWAGWRQTIDTLHERAPEHAPHRPALCRMLGWDLMRQGDWRRSIELFTEGLGLAERSGAEAEALLSRIGLSYALRSGREMARAYAAVHPVPAHADRLGLHWIEVRAHMALAGLVPGDGDLKEGIKHLRSAVDLARRGGDLRGEVAATVNLATILGTRAQHSDADILMEAALVRIRRLGRGRLEAEVMSFAGLRYLRRGDVDLAVEWLSQAAQMIVSMGHLDRQLLVRARLTRALAAQGKLKEASRLRAIVLSALQDAELSDSISVEIWVQLAHTAISTEEDRALRGAMTQVERILALHDADATMLVAEQELSMLRSAVGRSSVPLG
jgi:predicted ATPase